MSKRSTQFTPAMYSELEAFAASERLGRYRDAGFCPQSTFLALCRRGALDVTGSGCYGVTAYGKKVLGEDQS